MASPIPTTGHTRPEPTRPVPLREPVLQRLKFATHARHAALESRSVLLDPDLSRTRYLECLSRFFGYYAPLEGRLLASKAWQSAGFAYAERYKTPQLKQDLMALGVMPGQLPQLALCSSLPDLAGTAQLLGCLYVIEGATLGGQIISRHLHASLGLTPGTGGAFFGGYGAQTGSRWKSFGAHLTAFAEQSDCDDAIVASAQQTFETLDHWLYPAQHTAPPYDATASSR